MGLRSHKRIRNSALDHAIDLLIAGYFFACRICEIAKTQIPGQTKLCRLRCLTFWDKNKKEIPFGPKILLAHFVTVTFEDQKNGEKFEKRTQRRTDDESLCPVRRFGRAVLRVLMYVGNADADTFLCSTSSGAVRTNVITSEFTFEVLRSTCTKFGGIKEFGFRSTDIGNKSLRSGAAMGLFMTNTDATRIMILGRWKSTAFLKYIRSQTLEWTDNLSRDLILFENFTDLCLPNYAPNRDYLDKHQEKARNMVIPSFLEGC